MKKNDLKYDPFREKALKLVEAVSKNLAQYVALFLCAILAVVLLVLFSDNSKKSDLLQCLDLDALIFSESMKEYCESEEVIDFLDGYKTKNPSTAVEGLSLFYEIKETPKEERLEKLRSVNLSSLPNSIVKSKLYKVKGDLMLEKGLFLESIDTYIEANKAYSDSKTFSGLLFYKISKAYFLDFNENRSLESLNAANSYIKKSLNCKIGNGNILEAVKILASRITHEI